MSLVEFHNGGKAGGRLRSWVALHTILVVTTGCLGTRRQDVSLQGSRVTSRQFWSSYQPGFGVAKAAVGTSEFFAEVTKQRYDLEPHIPEVVNFGRWTGQRVLEAGCGIGTDGARFAAAGAQYTGLDFSKTGPFLARRRFQMEGLQGDIVVGSVGGLPFPDATFDMVYSHGVIHHVEDTAGVVRELHRVLKPGGTILVMVYHRRSLNYYVSIMLLRRVLVGLLMLPNAATLIAKATGEPEEVLSAHKSLLATHGIGYLRDSGRFLSHNTDGPGNPLSKVYTRGEVRSLYSGLFADIRTDVRYLNLRLYPGGRRFSRSRVGCRLERRVGWHLYATGVKAH